MRVAVPGDRARFDADGQVALLGRDSLVVNTGGEKVFVEEVEDVLKRHADVVDALVIGRPSERFGQEVVAIVQLARRAERRTPASCATGAPRSLARFKAPRAVRVRRRGRAPPERQGRLPLGARRCGRTRSARDPSADQRRSGQCEPTGDTRPRGSGRGMSV